ncbi:hypothetical protein [uncultured Cardiobacterium sp.]|uniref:hypothetical protein n=1 Tax=uncultured Cardiobacterium sp. TaxID=417619 RepID=UPI00262CAE69|nr:hypothetical protein [uncultured Cardiobacterium sp.]
MNEEADGLLNDSHPDPAKIAALIPLLQGHFLFRFALYLKQDMDVLIPLVQGRFLFRGYCFSSFVSIGCSDTFQVFVTQESCCLAATQIISGLFAVSGSVSGQARVLSGLYLHGVFCFIWIGIQGVMRPVYPFYAGVIGC